MQETRNQTHLCLTKSRCGVIFLMGCLLGAGTSRSLKAQTVYASVWSSEIDHRMESVIVFQSQTRERTDAYIHVYDDVLAQQIAEIKVAATSGASTAARAQEKPPSIDQEADTKIVNPLQAGVETIRDARGSDIYSSLMTQLAKAVKPKAYRIASGVTGSGDLESVAFRNPDGTDVLFTVNHSRSAVSLEAFWKDRLFTYTQAGESVAIFAWDPKSQLVSLVSSEARISAKGSVLVEAKCSNVSPVGVDLRCESQGIYCSIFPVHFTCSSQQESVTLSVAVYPTGNNDTHRTKQGLVTITAAPDVGEPTSLRIPLL